MKKLSVGLLIVILFAFLCACNARNPGKQSGNNPRQTPSTASSAETGATRYPVSAETTENNGKHTQSQSTTLHLTESSSTINATTQSKSGSTTTGNAGTVDSSTAKSATTTATTVTSDTTPLLNNNDGWSDFV